MEKIRVRFTADEDIVSTVIRFGTWSEYSHVDFITSSGKAIGCWPDDGVQYHDRTADRVQFAEIEVNSAARVEEFILAQLGKEYDWSAIFGMFVRRDWNNPDKWFCSELIAAALLYDNIVIAKKESNRITPQDLLESPLVKLVG